MNHARHIDAIGTDTNAALRSTSPEARRTRARTKLAGTALAALALTTVVGATMASTAPVQAAHAATVTHLTFDFPVGVAGPLAEEMLALVNEYDASHPAINVTPIFAGSYDDTMTKVQAGLKSGTEPDVAVLLSTDVYSLLNMKAILPYADFAKGDAGAAWMHSFYPAFMANSVVDKTVWGVPFQRSTVVMYYNKNDFAQAGLNPNQPPTTWSQLLSDAKKLTTPSHWGIEIPTSGTTYWVFQPFAIQAGQNVVGDSPNRVYFDTPDVIHALQFFVALSKTWKVEPSGLIGWTTAPSDFEAGKTAIIYHSSGSLASILKSSSFPVGVAMLPKDKRFGSPTGGGNLYILNTGNAAREQAAYSFVRWMTSPAIAAQWSVETGYVATSPAAYKTPYMEQYLRHTPQAAVARNQLRYAEKELATNDGEEIQSILSNACQAALTSNVTPAQALAAAQQEAAAALAQYAK